MAVSGVRGTVLGTLFLAACSRGPDPSTLVPAAPSPTAQGIPTGAPGAIGWGADVPAATATVTTRPRPMPAIPPSPMAPPLGPKKHGTSGGTAL